METYRDPISWLASPDASDKLKMIRRLGTYVKSRLVSLSCKLLVHRVALDILMAFVR